MWGLIVHISNRLQHCHQLLHRTLLFSVRLSASLFEKGFKLHLVYSIRKIYLVIKTHALMFSYFYELMLLL